MNNDTLYLVFAMDDNDIFQFKIKAICADEAVNIAMDSIFDGKIEPENQYTASDTMYGNGGIAIPYESETAKKIIKLLANKSFIKIIQRMV